MSTPRSDPALGAARDIGLLRAAAGGSDVAFFALYHRWAPRLEAFLLRATHSRPQAEDLVQETFLRVHRFAGTFEPRGEVGAWIFRIAANLLRSEWRRARRRPSTVELGAAESSVDRASEPGGEAGFARAVDHALLRLSRAHRVVFLLKVEGGLSYDEIAQAMQCNPATARTRFHYAVLRLRSLLKEWDAAELRSQHVQ